MIMQSSECNEMSQSGTSIRRATPTQTCDCSPSITITTTRNDKRSNKKSQHRRVMTKHILRLLRADQKSDIFEQEEFPIVAKEVELYLHKNSRSNAEYVDFTTLKERVHEALANISCKDAKKCGKPNRSSNGIPNIGLNLESLQQQLVRLFHATKCQNENCENEKVCMETMQLW
eukprot:CAMPEP_0113624344 /NCGR_PEP_ID=MMETSP0017_2-20120614/12544_1 /TAXON_ID=2856 /ORGANISM="Cylindrotheca closterium" /LENGTH=173 /DNA_ID=CAMNT_0000534361 /DNA_START=41 /DNA_END=559 /DNA_ORIENTATION=+ /assembly_acc=CAM_ASM_000147